MTRPQATLTPIAYDSGSPATAWRADVRSQGHSGPPACTFFVKLVHDVRLWAGLRFFPDDVSRADFAAYYPWHFELDIHRAGIDSVMPEGMRTPICTAPRPSAPITSRCGGSSSLSAPVRGSSPTTSAPPACSGSSRHDGVRGPRSTRRCRTSRGPRTLAGRHCGITPAAGFCGASSPRCRRARSGPIRSCRPH